MVYEGAKWVFSQTGNLVGLRKGFAKAETSCKLFKCSIVDGIVAGPDLGMCEAGHHGEVIAKFLERFQIRCERVILACFGWKKICRMHSERRADAEQTANRRRLPGGEGRRLQRFQHRQCERDASGPEELPT